LSATSFQTSFQTEPRVHRTRTVQIAVAFAAALALAALGSAETAPAGAETGYLALLAGAVLATVGLGERRPATALSSGALAAVAAAWALPSGPTRAAAVVAILAATLLAAAWQALRRTPDELPWEVLAPLACGLQLLTRAELLLPPVFSLERWLGAPVPLEPAGPAHRSLGRSLRWERPAPARHPGPCTRDHRHPLPYR